MATTATPWVGSQAAKLYLQSGQFTSTLKTSQSIAGIDSASFGISWDGTNTPWIGSQADKLYLQSGQFSSTLKTSESITTIDTTPQGISWDGNDTPWIGASTNKLYLQSGQFTSTLKTSEAIGTIDNAPRGISWDSINTPWIGFEADKLYLQSGQFTSTLKTSQTVGGIEIFPQGISWDGTNTPWAGFDTTKLYLQSGQFTSTLKTSQSIVVIDNQLRDIDTDDVVSRLGISNIDVNITLFIQGKNNTTNTNIFVGDIIEDKIFTFTPKETCTIDVNHPLGIVIHDELQDKFWVTSEDPTSGAPTDLTIDKGNQKLFITENTGRIVKTDFDGSSQEIIVTGLSDPQSIDIDESISTIFWTDKHIGVIQKSDLSGGSIQVVLSGLAAPEGLALDKANQRIFWSNVSGINIQSTNYDGSSTQDVIPSGLSNPRRLAFDNRNNKLYWTDFNLGVVQRSNSDGTNINTVAAGLSGPVGLDVLELNLSLFIEGSADVTPISEEISLYLGGIPSGDIPLFIEGKDNIAGNIALFIQGQPSGDIPLFISGKPSGEMDLFIEGFSPTSSGEMTLFIVGCAPKATPVVRPNLFNIPSTVIDIFEREVDALIRDLGKKIKLIYKPTIIDCPNCIFDLIGRKSANKFQSGGPQPFSDGARCPYCQGTGKTEQENSEIILGLVDWKPRDYQDFGISIQNSNAIVGIKTLATDAIKIQRATEAIVDYAISNIIKLRCRKLRDPSLTGLKNSRYAISFWQRI